MHMALPSSERSGKQQPSFLAQAVTVAQTIGETFAVAVLIVEVVLKFVMVSLYASERLSRRGFSAADRWY